jgi:universal stress protein E
VGPALWRYHETPSVHVRAGNPTRVLIETLKEKAPDLLVLGRYRPQGAWDAIAGTIAARVLSERRYPVLIVDRRAWRPYHNVVLALDCTPASAEALRVAEALVLNDGMRSVIVHAYQPPNDAVMTSAGIAADVVSRYSESWHDEAEVALRARLMLASENFSRYELRLGNGTPSDAIQNVARHLRPDLLVLGTRGRDRLGRALLRSVANRVLATARCDDLVVPDRSGSTTLWRNRIDRRSLEVITGV